VREVASVAGTSRCLWLTDGLQVVTPAAGSEAVGAVSSKRSSSSPFQV
jgi:hypothetical protein